MTTSNTPFKKSKTCPVTAADQKPAVSQSRDTSTPPPMPEPHKILPYPVWNDAGKIETREQVIGFEWISTLKGKTRRPYFYLRKHRRAAWPAVARMGEGEG
ncbi:hypothetical protein [Endozoicomonas acroporae]|uniref:hypothetical protein n=1 Tax=Endozoicomonas acroporae TaxID=1701104 RepID=UPI0013D3C3CF|nr:hypothetical protein [Endozoicomonas acroporae]